MRWFGFYFVRTLVNGVKKLLRTWVAIFLAVCLLFGVAAGVIGSLIGNAVDSLDNGGSAVVEETPEEEPFLDVEIPPPDEALVHNIVETLAGGVVLLVLLFSIYNGDKSGSKIFLMSDVNFLFTAPLRPQSVLLFRVILQAGTAMVASLYLLFQIPNLVSNVGLSLWAALALVGCWFVTLLLSKLLSVLTYTLVATHPRVRRFLRPGVFGVVLVLLGATVVVSRLRGVALPDAALWLYGAGASRWVPGWGWIKGIIGYVMEGRLWPVLWCLAGVLALAAGLVYLTWRLKADFYEDALAHAAETQAALEAAAEGRRAKRKTKRPRRLRRDILRHGQGASMFLIKGIYNRHRFALWGVFTATGTTYLGIYLVWAIFCRLTDIPPVMYLLLPGAAALMIAFFRNLTNPLEQDMALPYLYLAPESAFKKAAFSLLAGSYDTLLDVLPGLLIATLLLRASPAEAALWLLAILSLDLMSSTSRMLLTRVLPDSLPVQIKAMLLLMIKMLLAALPLTGLILGSILVSVPAGLAIASACHLFFAAVCFVPAQALLHEGGGGIE